MKNVLKWLLGGGGPAQFVVVSLRVVLDNTKGESCSLKKKCNVLNPRIML